MIRCDRPKVVDKWHLDEVVLPINGKKYWLWRAVNNRGDVLDILIQSRRNNRAAGRFLRKLFKAFGEPRVVVTDKLRSYGAALKELAPGIERRSHKGLNNRSEGSHRPTRRREKIMGRFRSPPTGSAVLIRPRPIPKHFPPTPPHPFSRILPPSKSRRPLNLGRHHAWVEGSLKSNVRTFAAKIADNLTMPVRAQRLNGG